MTSVSVGHIILRLTQPVERGRPPWGSNPGPPHQESRDLPAELPRPPRERERKREREKERGRERRRERVREKR